MFELSHRLVSRLRFRDLQLLAAIASEGSLRRAADQLGVTQPALSRTLAEIEDVFGCPLFLRTSRGLVPNEQGDAAVRGALQLLRELGRVSEEVTRSSLVSAILRIGAPPFIAHGYLPRIFQWINQTQQTRHVMLKLVEGTVGEIFDQLNGGEVDALITTYADRAAEGGRFSYESLFPSRYVLVAPPSFQLAAGSRAVSLRELSDQPWVMPSYASMLRKDIEKAFLGARAIPPKPAIESNHPFTTVHFVAQGCGLAFVPAMTLNHVEKDLVQRLALQEDFLSSPVALVYLTGSQNHQLQLLRQAVLANCP